MGIFSAVVGTIIETLKLPAALARDAGEVMCGEDPKHVDRKLEQIKREADKADAR